MSVEHIALEKVENPKLVVALKRWCRLCGQGEFYRREELGFGPLVGTPEILNGRSLMLATGADDPMNYVFAFFGGDFNVYDDRNFVARRLRDTSRSRHDEGLHYLFCRSHHGAGTDGHSDRDFAVVRHPVF